MRWFVPLLAVLALSGCVSDSAEEPPTGPKRDIPIGLAANVDGSGPVATEMAVIRRAGAHWLREDLEWARVEPQPGVRDWAYFDKIVEAAARNSVEVLPILDESPCWAVKPGTAPDECWKLLPEDAAFARFGHAAVARYGPGGDFWRAHPDLDPKFAVRAWEVWNEPYLHTGAQPVSASRYSGLFEAVADAGRAEDPQSKWLFAGAAKGTREDGSQFDWLPAVAEVRPELATKISALSVHVYPVYKDGEALNATAGTAAVVETFEQSFGTPVTAWVTELGFAACDRNLGEDRCVPGEDRAAREIQKAKLMTQGINQFRRTTFTDAVFVYTLREFDTFFYGDSGLLRANGDRLPAYAAFKKAATAADGP